MSRSDDGIWVRYAWVVERSQLIHQLISSPVGESHSADEAQTILVLTDELVFAVAKLAAILRNT